MGSPESLVSPDKAAPTNWWNLSISLFSSSHFTRLHSLFLFGFLVRESTFHFIDFNYAHTDLTAAVDDFIDRTKRGGHRSQLISRRECLPSPNCGEERISEECHKWAASDYSFIFVTYSSSACKFVSKSTILAGQI